jgi:V/A-type H+-transporting ATPase subunit D
MQKVRLTKTNLKQQRDALGRYERYLPTLRIKKQQLQREIDRTQAELRRVREKLDTLLGEMDQWVELLAEDVGLEGLLELERIEIRWDNVAGVEVPLFVKAHTRIAHYDLFSTPLWVDQALVALQQVVEFFSQQEVLREQQRRLQREQRTTAQRVNLLERIKIPEAQGNIRRIAVHLGDQQTAAFGWALLAKRKAAVAAVAGRSRDD